VLHAAQEFPSVAGAVADCTWVLGTTAVGERVLEHPLHLLPAAAPLVQQHLAASSGARVALLFGSEKTGLSNDELSHCHALVTIPMNPVADRHLSMNLGQAVAVCLYALATESRVPEPSQSPQGQRVPTDLCATAGEIDRLNLLLRDVLDNSGYARRNPANSREANIRRLVRRMANSSSDASVWTGILRQMLYALSPVPLAVPRDSSQE
jgi:TrmH family RNA methyltransferase